MWLLSPPQVAPESQIELGGIRFECKAATIPIIERALVAYFKELKIKPNMVAVAISNKTIYQITLASPLSDTNTLALASRPEFAIEPETTILPTPYIDKKIQTVSKKEIVLALLQHGRTTVFKDSNCHINALKEHVEIRQNIVSWAQTLQWQWPDGGAARWNSIYWNKGTPVVGHKLTSIFMDVFQQPFQYAIGCYTATKLVIVQGTLDYYHRVKKNPNKLNQLERRLLADGEPLIDVEPPSMWFFEDTFDPQSSLKRGKILDIHYQIPADNFVPGDWAYILNTDKQSASKTGYEGSNALYLGGNRFADFYDDYSQKRSLEEKLDDVYQWRFGVFNRERDFKKIRQLTDAEAAELRKSPVYGGLLFDYRAVPRLD
jgi:hypothetical protein